MHFSHLIKFIQLNYASIVETIWMIDINDLFAKKTDVPDARFLFRKGNLEILESFEVGVYGDAFQTAVAPHLDGTVGGIQPFLCIHDGFAVLLVATDDRLVRLHERLGPFQQLLSFFSARSTSVQKYFTPPPHRYSIKTNQRINLFKRIEQFKK